MSADLSDIPAIVWRRPDGEPLTCHDKIVLLNDNLREFRQEGRDVLEDALLMGCDESQIREVLHGIIDSLENPFRK